MLFYNGTFSLDIFLYIRLAMTCACILLNTVHLNKKQGEKVVLLKLTFLGLVPSYCWLTFLWSSSMVTDCGGDSVRASVHPRLSSLLRATWHQLNMPRRADGLMKGRFDYSLMEATESLTGEPVRWEWVDDWMRMEIQLCVCPASSVWLHLLF